MRFCSTLGWLIGCGVLLHASDAGAPGQRITSEVHADAKSGKLVRSVIVTAKPVKASTIAPRVVPETPVVEADTAKITPAMELNEAIARIAAQNSLQPELIHSVIKVESNYNSKAVSSKGAQGMMQLIPATARRFGVADSFDAMDNIQGGAKYLKYLLELYHNDAALALAAYNAGEGAVAKYGDVPPYKETQNYLHLVAEQLRKMSQSAGGAGQAQPVKQPEETAPAERHMQPIVDRDGSVRYVSR